jgi:molybdopterin-guanine dinucleotide biosynthesis protein A
MSRKTAAVILAGGRAHRYSGAPKGLIELSPGQTILARTIAEIRSSGVGDIAISANDDDLYGNLGLPIIPDLRTDLGPIGGIEAGLAHFRQDYEAVLFLPCDLPAVTCREISRLVSEFYESGVCLVYAQDARFLSHPLCTVVRNDLGPEISRLVDEGHRKLTDIWASLGGKPVTFQDDEPFYNVNAPADLDRWRGK